MDSKIAILEVQVPVFIKVHYDEADNCYYSTSEFIDIVRDGQTPEEALKMFCEAFDIMVESSLKLGTFTQLMEEGGYICDERIIPAKGRIIRCRLPNSVTVGAAALKSDRDLLTFDEYTYNSAGGNFRPCPA